MRKPPVDPHVIIATASSLFFNSFNPVTRDVSSLSLGISIGESDDLNSTSALIMSKTLTSPPKRAIDSLISFSEPTKTIR